MALPVTKPLALLGFLSASLMLVGGCAAQKAAERERLARDAITACQTAYPPNIPRQNVVRAQCLNDAEKKIYGPTYSFPDLLTLKHEYKLALARKIDKGEMSPEDARLQFAEVNTRIQTLFEARRNARAAADAQSARALYSGLALLQSSRPITTTCNRFGLTTTCNTQ